MLTAIHQAQSGFTHHSELQLGLQLVGHGLADSSARCQSNALRLRIPG